MQDVHRFREECYRQRRILLPYRYAWEERESILHGRGAKGTSDLHTC